MVSKSEVTRDSDDKRRRVPKHRLYGEYPNIDSEQFPSGRQIIVSNEPDAESFREESKGHYAEINDHDGRTTYFHKGGVFEATPKGLTTTTGGATDAYVQSNMRHNTGGSSHSEVKKHTTSAVGGTSVAKIDGASVVARNGEHWSVSKSASPGGDMTSSSDGDQHVQTRGDLVVYRVGNRIESTKGEVYEDVQGGNKSTVVAKKYKVDVGDVTNIKGEKDITIESSTTIILKVGESKITITSKDITIEAAENLHLKAKKAVITKGDQDGTKLQGGGPRTPPNTVK